MDFLSPEYFQSLLKPEMQAQLTQYLLVVAVVWATMGRKVSSRFREFQRENQQSIDRGLSMFQTHLSTIEKKFDEGIKEMRQMKEAVTKDLKVNSERLQNVETDMNDIKQRVTTLESPH